ncbi:MAG: TetR/AcrR family transcriptional regulator C-terminal domain-containing protein [Oscillospiraceae bacterium]|nr:TetR/AcrR family transcriptional regulator C-terminal domain-containing protein [Oscillospiraceae bacterium]
MNNSDRRTTRTKRALKRAMLELLSKKNISKITVSELSELADIGRNTFYLHYMDAYDLLDKLENEIIEQITAHTSPIMEYSDYDSLLIHLANIWQYVYENLDIFRILMNQNNITRFMDKMKGYCIKSVLSASNSYTKNTTEDYHIIYYISGSLGMFQKWIEDGASIPPDKLAQIARELIIGTA